MKNKINVNISPNPLDLQTLHCSQNDTEERKFYFTLHNNGEVIDTTGISDPIFEPFSVYKGGTEQLLPVNTDDPTTSPIIADIQYPDEEKTEQEFTYRESPTTIDGNAIIEKLYGNTLVWNQLASSSGATETKNGVTFTNNGDGTWSTSGSSSSGTYKIITSNFNVKVNHKYLLRGCASGGGSTKYVLEARTTTNTRLAYADEGSGSIFTYTEDATAYLDIRFGYGGTVNMDGLKFIPQVFDLTQMYGSGNEPTVEEFKSLFPLPYYSYGQKLLPFKGEGIKTTSKNLFNTNSVQGSTSGWQTANTNPRPLQEGYYYVGLTGNNYFTANQITDYSVGDEISVTSSASGYGLGFCVRCMPNTDYTIKYDGTGNYRINFGFYDVNGKFLLYIGAVGSLTPYATSPSDAYYLVVCLTVSVNSSTATYKNIELEIGQTASDYEPYQSSTTSIPTLTYFPTGMKSAGSVFDELTNSKAITRVGEVDLGSLTWTRSVYSGVYYFASQKTDMAQDNNRIHTVCAKYSSVTANSFSDMVNGTTRAWNDYIQIRDDSYTLASDFKNAMDGVMLQYELAEEEETQFAQASLICEDGESTLYQDVDSLVCDCTEDFSKDSGFKDCKIKFTNDDGVVYSNKIQLHIERKP